MEISIEAPVSVLVNGSGERLAGRSEAISLSTIVLLLDFPLAPGETLDIRINGERLSAVVDSCATLDTGYELACAIIDWRSRGDMHAIIRDLLPLAVC